jgi:hypothetical protein
MLTFISIADVDTDVSLGNTSGWTIPLLHVYTLYPAVLS